MLRRLPQSLIFAAIAWTLPWPATNNCQSQVIQWTGPDGGSWNEPQNWSSGTVPCLRPGTGAVNVMLDGTSHVRLGEPNCSVTGITTSPGSELFLLPSSSLNIVRDAELSGHIEGVGGTLSAPNATFSRHASTFRLDNGSDVRVGYSEFDSSRLIPDDDLSLIDISGAESRLEFRNATSLNAGFNRQDGVPQTQRIQVESGSLLMQARSLEPPVERIDRLMVTADDGADIDLRWLTNIGGTPDTTGGTVSFEARDASTMTLGRLDSASRVTMSATEGSVLQAGPAWAENGVFSSKNFREGGDILHVSGANSELRLTPFRVFDFGFNRQNGVTEVQRIVADQGGEFSAVWVEKLIGPVGAEDRLDVLSMDGATLSLERLTDIRSDWRGQIRIEATRERLAAEGAVIELGPIEHMSDTTLLANRGSVISGKDGPVAGTYDTTRFREGGDMIHASGPSSSIDLPSFHHLDMSMNRQNGVRETQRIVSDSRASVSLPNVQKVTAPVEGIDAVLIEAINDGDVSLPGLTTVESSWRGTVEFYAGRTDPESRTTSTIRLGQFESIDNAKFRTTHGGTIDASQGNTDAIGSMTTSQFRENAEIVSAHGPGSLVDLTSIRDLDAEFNRQNGVTETHTFRAIDGGTVKLSNLQDLTLPVERRDAVRFEANAGTLELSSLSSVTGWGRLELVSTNGGVLDVGSIPSTANTSVHVTGAGSTLHAHGAVLSVESEWIAGKGNIVSNARHHLFEIDDPSRWDMDDSVLVMENGLPQFLEVGGVDRGVQNDMAGNFSIGELRVGKDGADTTIVELVQLFNNSPGNGDEALYLNGIDGSDGLSIAPGSTLVLGDTDAYARIDGEVLELQSLFAPGADTHVLPGGGILAKFAPLQPGDANQDFKFDASDLIAVFDKGKYETGQPASWSEGDWNGGEGGKRGAPLPGDGLFNASDIVAAFSAGVYELGFYSASAPGFSQNDVQAVPEPSANVLLLIGLLALMHRRSNA